MARSVDEFIAYTQQAYPHITLSDLESSRSILQQLRSPGIEALHIIADFDMTLTKHWITTASGPTRNLSSHAVLERGPAVSASFAAHTKALAERYYPHEIDPSLAMPRKIELMIEWWSAAHAAMIQEKLTRQQIHQQAVHANMTWRSGLQAFIDLLDRQQVPLLVFSAGIADVIEELLLVSHLNRGNQFIVSNHMLFSSSGDPKEDQGDQGGSKVDDVLVGFAEPLIHTFNKGEQALYHSSALAGSVAQTLQQRKNVVLLGDSIGDAKMADGVAHDTKLSIGFCNFGGPERKQEFLRTFDVVVEGDESLGWVTDLVAWLSSDEPS